MTLLRSHGAARATSRVRPPGMGLGSVGSSRRLVVGDVEACSAKRLSGRRNRARTARGPPDFRAAKGPTPARAARYVLRRVGGARSETGGF